MSVKETVMEAGQKVAENAQQAANWVKEKTGLAPDQGVAGVRERMDVIASCGSKIGVVDHIEGSALKLTKKDSKDGQHHFVPLEWIERVDSHVHLKKNSTEATQQWKTDAASCGC